MRLLTRSICVSEYEEDQDRAGQAESSVRDLVGRMEERCDAPKLQPGQSVHEGIGFAEAIPASAGVR